MYAADGDKRCRLPAARDGFCKRHHPEYLIASAKKRIDTYERLLNEERCYLKALEAQWYELERELAERRKNV